MIHISVATPGLKRFAAPSALVGTVTVLSACGGAGGIDPTATANYIDDVEFKQTGFRPVDVRCPSGIPATVGGRFTATSPALRVRTPPTYG